MKKRLLKLTVLLLLVAISGYAQERTVSGKVSATDGSGMPGVNVLLKGTSSGTTTNADGGYKIEVPSDESVLVFSFIGNTSQEIVVGSKTTIDITLQEDATQLGEVVVTALGIEKDSKTLSYSMQQVDGDKLNVVRDANFINGIAGKVPGLVINRSSAGPGGSVRILLRGQKSTGNNQPLIVIDGLPISSTNSSQSADIWSGQDNGDVLSMINPADIESMSVLKGASASTLYGSLGQNGVILITTKKGKNGTAKVDFSSNYTIEKPMYQPELQYDYLQSGPDAIYSWGAKGKSKDHAKSFLNTGTTWINNLSITGGSEKAQAYFSYANTDNKGMLPTSTFKQNTFTFRESVKVSDKFSVDGNVILGLQKVHNRLAGGLYFNPLTGLYLFPRGLDFNQYKNYQYFSPTRKIYMQDWWNLNYDKGLVGADNQQNPYWILNKNTNDLKRQNVFGSLTLKYQLKDWVKVQVRGNVNDIVDEYEQKVYAGTQGTLSDSTGRYVLQDGHSTVAYGDAMFIGEKQLTDDVGLSFTLGTSIRHEKFTQDFIDSKGSNLAYTNVFTLGAIIPSKSMTQLNRNGTEQETQSVFATTSFDFKKAVFLDLTLRNDWSSSLAYTSKMKSGYLYYSGGLNVIISELVTLPSAISFAKLRGSFAQIGNGVAPYATSQVITFNAGNQINANFKPLGELKPETQQSIELGAELKFAQDRIALDVTVYKIDNKDQFFNISAPRGSGVSRVGINVGDVQNKGLEASLTADVIKGSYVNWTAALNYTKNVNKVTGIPLSDGKYALSEPGVNAYGLYLREGGSFGDIYGKKFLRHEGKIVVDPTGKPLTDTKGLQYLGNPIPKFMLSLNNTITFKNFAVSLLIDGRFGGKVMSLTQSVLDEYGVSKATGDARDNGGVDVPAVVSADGGVTFTGEYSGSLPADIFYQTVGGRANITEHYMYDATNVRVRELSIGYKIPANLKFIRDIRFSVIGRNLFFITKKAPYDPELSMSSGNGVQGVDAFVLPSTRSIGLSVKCTF
jgi:TonB-linked SusC/RagA family outer membrane protein